MNSKKFLKLKQNTQGSPYRRVPDISKINKIYKIKKFIDLNEGLKKLLNGMKN